MAHLLLHFCILSFESEPKYYYDSAKDYRAASTATSRAVAVIWAIWFKVWKTRNKIYRDKQFIHSALSEPTSIVKSMGIFRIMI